MNEFASFKMTGVQWGILLLCTDLGDGMLPLTLAQIRRLRQALRLARPAADPDRDLTAADLADLGCDRAAQERILALLGREERMSLALADAAGQGIYPLIWGDPAYPAVLRQRLGDDAPPVLFTRGDRSLLSGPCVSVVGSRRLEPPGADFARRAGTYAALEGFVLCSGDAEGADRTAQTACLSAGGQVIAVTSDRLTAHPVKHSQLLYLAETGWDLPFTAARALRRNRLIHAMGDKVLVAQTACGSGGTWHGTTENLRHGWSPVFVRDDGSPGAEDLITRGATPIPPETFHSITLLTPTRRIWDG